MAQSVYPEKPNTLLKLFHKDKAIIGVIHSLPIPGSPQYHGEDLNEKAYDYAVSEAEAYVKGGVDGIIVENAWDIPFLKPEDIGIETVAAMSVMVDRVRQAVSVPIGVNCLANGAIQALAVAKATGVSFIRSNQWANAYIANEGFVEGAAAKALRYRHNIGAEDVVVFADVHVKHGSHSIVADRSVEEQTRDVEWFAADVLIATGNRTGHATPLEEVQKIKSATNLPVIVGSGLSGENVENLFTLADGAIVASSLKQGGVWWNPVNVDSVCRLMEIVNRIRSKAKPC